MTTRKYPSPEERKAAARARAKERQAIIHALLEEHRENMRRLGVAQFKAQVAGDAPAPSQEITGVTHEHYAPLIAKAAVRQKLIRALLENHYDELKAELDAYRLIKDSQA